MATVLLRNPHIHKMLELPWKQGSMATKFINFEGIISHMHKRIVSLLIYLTYDVVLSSHVPYYINKKDQC